MKIGHVRTIELQKFKKDINKLTDSQVRDKFFSDATMRMGNFVMGKVKELTPVGDYSKLLSPYDNRVGGTLRDSWKISELSKRGNDTYSVRVMNPQRYASYVNYGHKQQVGRYVPALGKKLKVGWVKGQHFLEKAEYETIPRREKLIRPLLKAYLDKGFKND